MAYIPSPFVVSQLPSWVSLSLDKNSLSAGSASHRIQAAYQLGQPLLGHRSLSDESAYPRTQVAYQLSQLLLGHKKLNR